MSTPELEDIECPRCGQDALGAEQLTVGSRVSLLRFRALDAAMRRLHRGSRSKSSLAWSVHRQEGSEAMTKKQLDQQAMEALEAYYCKYTPHDQFRHMIEDGIINEKGEVLVTRAEREAGHPIDDAPSNGTAPIASPS